MIDESRMKEVYFWNWCHKWKFPGGIIRTNLSNLKRRKTDAS